MVKTMYKGVGMSWDGGRSEGLGCIYPGWDWELWCSCGFKAQGTLVFDGLSDGLFGGRFAKGDLALLRSSFSSFSPLFLHIHTFLEGIRN